MITIQVLGLDQYVVGHYSRDCSADIANLLETNLDEINFYSPCDSLLFHNGVEQTSWNTVVFVKIPSKYKPFEGKLAHYLLETLKDFSINVEVNFEYIEEGRSYIFINDDYPRFLTEDNIAKEDDEDEHSEEECHDDCCHHHHDDDDNADDDLDEADPRDRADLDYNNPDELYLGDAFEGHQEELDALDKKMK